MNTTTPANQEQPRQEHVLAIKELSVAFGSRQRTRTIPVFSFVLACADLLYSVTPLRSDPFTTNRGT